ncbi:MAG: 23S rRNA (uracil(1939)-C(5))-methyltransferase RlmD [Lachnospiraceae bacterium]|nr:23S rRNA (uracil(1939)-C(5))-methyltransferase RlmD [Lachnospiraceae bacterium]
MNKNDIIELNITDIGVNGEGIGKFEGCTFFVKDAIIGDTVQAVITKVKKGYAYAKMLKILEPSEKRINPICPVAFRCGGCQIMQMSYASQLEFKEKKVRGNLERLGGISFAEDAGADVLAAEGPTFYPIIGANMAEGESVPTQYRNKMQFPIGKNKEGAIVTGFYAGRTHYIIETEKCLASRPEDNKILAAVRAFAQEHQLSTYDETIGKGLLRHVMIRNGFSTGQVMVCLVINGDTLEKGSRCDAKDRDLEKKLVEHLLAVEPKIASICLNINKENTNAILGRKNICLYGKEYITDEIVCGEGALQFQISPLSFFQVNSAQTSKLYGKALEFADLKGEENVWDLYCGIGTISLFLAGKAKKVYGVEIVPEAIEDAKNNARLNGIENAEFFCGKSEEVFPQLANLPDEQGENRSADVVVLDPPRKGCDKILLDKIMEVGPEKIVYVSCDSATLARDLKILTSDEEANYTYTVEKVQPVDMFPNTVHVETVALLVKKRVYFNTNPI